MSGHTPGVWKLAADDSAFVYALNDDGHNRMWLNVNGGHLEGMVRTSDAELLANARLIAAAPELLNVLLRLVAPFDGAKAAGMDLPQAVIESDSKMLANIRAAISKATGAS